MFMRRSSPRLQSLVRQHFRPFLLSKTSGTREIAGWIDKSFSVVGTHRQQRQRRQQRLGRSLRNTTSTVSIRHDTFPTPLSPTSLSKTVPSSTQSFSTMSQPENVASKKRKLEPDDETDAKLSSTAAAAATTSDEQEAEMSLDKDGTDGTKKRRGPNNRQQKQKKTSVLSNRGEGKKGEVHPGSFACPALRKQFGIELPELDVVPEADDKEVSGEENTTKAEEEVDEREQMANKRRKRKVVFLLAYLGKNYAGFQMNEEQRTLQAEFELALYRAKLISSRNFGYPFKYSWSTSGRTDKGVHACAQVCSAKIEILPAQNLTQVLEELNNLLPDDIRVLEVNRVTQGFCAKTQRERVRYQYMIPSFMLQDVATARNMFKFIGYPENGRFPGDPFTPEEFEIIKPQVEPYRVQPAQLELLKKALKTYEGTHSFHNFSKGVKCDEARANRYILSFHVEDPIVFENGTEWIPTQVLGQSFLLHQIRKMVCMAVDVARGAAPLETLKQAFLRSQSIQVPPAPAQGLFLEMSFYDGYNRKKRKDPSAGTPDLIWTNEETDIYKRWKEFRNGVVMKHVVEEEHKDGNFIKYLFQHEFLHDYRIHYKLDEAKQEENNEAKGEQANAESQTNPDESNTEQEGTKPEATSTENTTT